MHQLVPVGSGPLGDRFRAEVIIDRRWSATVRAVVAIPARNEAEALPLALAALARQHDEAGIRVPSGAYEVLVLLNNCRDDSAAALRAVAPRLDLQLRVLAVELPAFLAHAGAARHLAMAAAADRLDGPDGALLTTDADSRVGRRWLARNLRALETGAAAVAGEVVPTDAAHLPASLRRWVRLEQRYRDVLIDLAAALPGARPSAAERAAWSGASLGMTLAAFRAVGGVPIVPVGEDKALLDSCVRSGLAVRRDRRIRVGTSARLDGRAPGGMASTWRAWSAEGDATVIAGLDPVDALLPGAAGRPAGARRPIRLRALGAETARAEAVLRAIRAAPEDVGPESWAALRYPPARSTSMR